MKLAKDGSCDIAWESPECSKNRSVGKERTHKQIDNCTFTIKSTHSTIHTSPLQTAGHLSPTIKFKYSSPSQASGTHHSTPLSFYQKKLKCKRKRIPEFSNEDDNGGVQIEKDWDEDSFFDESTIQATQKCVDDYLLIDNLSKDGNTHDDDSFFDEYTLQITQKIADDVLAIDNRASTVENFTSASQESKHRSSSRQLQFSLNMSVDATETGIPTCTDSDIFNNTFDENDLASILDAEK